MPAEERETSNAKNQPAGPSAWQAQALGHTACRLLSCGTTAEIRARLRQGIVAVTQAGEAFVLSSLAERAPWAVSVPGLPLDCIAPAQVRLVVEPGAVILAGTELRVRLAGAAIWSPMPPTSLAPPEMLRATMAAATLPWPPPGLLGCGCETLLERVRTAAHVADAPTIQAVAAGMVGLGRGLTPAGDDLLSGLAGTTALLGHSLLNHSLLSLDLKGRTTTLGATQLAHALRGELIEPLHEVIRLLVTASPAVPGAIQRLLAVGHSSGADMLAGVGLGLAYALAAEHRVPVPFEDQSLSTARPLTPTLPAP